MGKLYVETSPTWRRLLWISDQNIVKVVLGIFGLLLHRWVSISIVKVLRSLCRTIPCLPTNSQTTRHLHSSYDLIDASNASSFLQRKRKLSNFRPRNLIGSIRERNVFSRSSTSFAVQSWPRWLGVDDVWHPMWSLTLHEFYSFWSSLTSPNCPGDNFTHTHIVVYIGLHFNRFVILRRWCNCIFRMCVRTIVFI